jgi:ubiquinone/menaquinone biosynthesis C-methylase UbiE
MIDTKQALSLLEKEDREIVNWIKENILSSKNFSHIFHGNEKKNDYQRFEILKKPIEITWMYWPPNSSSAIHEHDDFHGFIYVKEGCLDNIEYHYDTTTKRLYEKGFMKGWKEGYFRETPYAIHQIANRTNRPAISLHIYMPPIHSFAGTKIFDPDQRRIGILNEKASKASWKEPLSSFDQIIENAFHYIPLHQAVKRSHHIVKIISKPKPEEIYRMIEKYYAEQASLYDWFDLAHESRKIYTDTINKIVAKDFQQTLHEGAKVLDIACGTGRRAITIQKQSGISYEIYGADASPKMLKIAQKRNIQTICKKAEELVMEEKFDAITFLYAFGHIPTSELRKITLQNIYASLKKGGKLYLDVFNLEDTTEWGPQAMKFYEREQLFRFGYEPGDLFYKKTQGKEIAYLHYFRPKEIENLLKNAGFHIEKIQLIGYVHQPGKIFHDFTKGNMMIIAVKQ